jgi:uncharacterized membrane protein
MVLAHVSDSWTIDADRRGDAWNVVAFIGGVASPLFLFLAGVATALSAESKGIQLARRRGWQIFALGFVFRLQSQLLGLGPLQNLFKVDMLNMMGVSMVAAASVWPLAATRHGRIAWLAVLTGAIAMITPIVRDVSWLAPLPDPLEAYLRPAGPYAAFPFFPWAAFLFAGVLAGELVAAMRPPRDPAPVPDRSPARQVGLQNGFAILGGAGVVVAWLASFRPSIYPSASFWHDSPTFFFIRLGLVTLLVPVAWIVERLLPARLVLPLVTLGRSSLFVYWIHVEMVYGVMVDPIKRSLPLWLSLTATALLCILLYGFVLLKNHLVQRHGLPGPWRILAPVIR